MNDNNNDNLALYNTEVDSFVAQGQLIPPLPTSNL